MDFLLPGPPFENTSKMWTGGPVLWPEMSFKLKNGYICNPLDGLADG